MRFKVVFGVLFGLLALAGVAKASGVFEHADPAKDVVATRVQALEATMRGEARGAASSAIRGPRGARGPKGPKGAQGVPGPAGPAGPTGPTGSFGSVVTVAGPPTFLCAFESGACAVGSTKVECPPGTVLVGGGYTGAGIVTTVAWSAPVGNAWAIIAVNLDEVPVSNLRASARCAGS